MFPRFSSSSSFSSLSSLPFVCDRCSKQILPEESILTLGKGFFHRNCFFCSVKQCGRVLSLAEYAVYQNELFCPNCFVSLFSMERSDPCQPDKAKGQSNGSAVQPKKEGNAIVRQHYERQLRTVELGDEQSEDEWEGQEEKEEEGDDALSGRSSDWSGSVGTEEKSLLLKVRREELSPKLLRGGRFGQSSTSPIPEVEEKEEDPVHSPSALSSALSPRGPRPHRPSVCKRCALRVFDAEKIIAAGEVWHKRCFRCLRCGRSLEPGKFSDRVGEVFCNNCYAKQFGPKGIGCGIGAGILQMHQ